MKKTIFMMILVSLTLAVIFFSVWYFFIVEGEKTSWSDLNLTKIQDTNIIKTATRQSDYLLDLEMPDGKAYTAIYSYSVTAGFDLSQVKSVQNGDIYSLYFPQPEIFEVDNEGEPLILNDIGSADFSQIIQRNKIFGAEFVYKNAINEGILDLAKKGLLQTYPQMISDISGIPVDKINILFIQDDINKLSGGLEVKSPIAPLKFKLNGDELNEWELNINKGEYPESGKNIISGNHPVSGTRFSFYPFLKLEYTAEEFFEDNNIAYGKLFNPSSPDYPLYSYYEGSKSCRYFYQVGTFLYRLEIDAPSPVSFRQYSAFPLLLISGIESEYFHYMISVDEMGFPLSAKRDGGRNSLIDVLLTRLDAFQLMNKEEIIFQKRYHDLLFLEDIPVFFDSSQVNKQDWMFPEATPEKIREIDNTLKISFSGRTENEWKELENNLLCVFYDSGGFFGRERIFCITRDSVFFQYLSGISSGSIISSPYLQFTPEIKDGRLIPFADSDVKIISKELSLFILFLKNNGFFTILP